MSTSAAKLFTDFAESAKVAPIRSMRQFAEQEIIIPDGDFQDLPFRVDRQPFTKLWFDACDDSQWNTFVACGPTQTGKSLSCLVIPACYHLFEMRENVIIGVPRMEIAEEKWFKDIQPTIMKTSYADLLPRKGPGSKGGIGETMMFANGAILKFMTGGVKGGVRAFTSRVVLITETDAFVQSTKGNQLETNPIRQLIARTRHYSNRKRIYMECTVTNQSGYIWSYWSTGSQGQIALQCPYCHKLIVPFDEIKEGLPIQDKWRLSLRGWQDAEDEVTAGEKSFFYCPSCAAKWTEEDRREANLYARVIHRGQTVSSPPCDPEIIGSLPRTRTFSLRWSAPNNFFTDSHFIGEEEWKAANSSESDAAQLEVTQYVWTIPIDILTDDTALLSTEGCERRFSNDIEKGKIPHNAISICCGLDLGLRFGHFVLLAAVPCSDDEPIPESADDDHPEKTLYHINLFDYGVINIPIEDLGAEVAMPAALRDFRDHLHTQYPNQIDQIWCDARYHTDLVYEVSRDESQDLPIFRPCWGWGRDQQGQGVYSSPKKDASHLLYVGTAYHINEIETAGVERVDIDSVEWKCRVHAGFLTPRHRHSSICLFAPLEKKGHRTFAKHLTAARQRRQFVLNRGVVTKWEQLRHADHFFDATYLALAALDFSINTDVRSARDELSRRKPADSQSRVRRLLISSQ